MNCSREQNQINLLRSKFLLNRHLIGTHKNHINLNISVSLIAQLKHKEGKSPNSSYFDILTQGGRSWKPFGEGKNAHKNFSQPHICYFRNKCVIFARNCKFANLIQYNMQYILCNNALLAQETLLLSKESTFMPKGSNKCVNCDKSNHRDKIAYVSAQNFRLSQNFSAKALRAFAQLLPPCSDTQHKSPYFLAQDQRFLTIFATFVVLYQLNLEF